MKLITIFNFPDDDNYNKLCHWWLKQALENTDMPIEIWHQNNIDHLDFDFELVVAVVVVVVAIDQEE